MSLAMWLELAHKDLIIIESIVAPSGKLPDRAVKSIRKISAGVAFAAAWAARNARKFARAFPTPTEK